MHRSSRVNVRARTIALAALFAAALAPPPAQAWTYKVIHDFCSKRACADGADAEAGLLLDSTGNLYGTTAGGPNGQNSGVVFELTPASTDIGWKSHTLYTFCYLCDGALPGKLIIDTSGNLYGTGHYGAVFELARTGSHHRGTLRILAEPKYGYFFSGLTYQGAQSGAPYDGTSPLYGATDADVIELTFNGGSWSESSLYHFCSLENCLDGYFNEAGVILDAAGNIYGATLDGGAHGQYGGGTAFQLENSGGSWSETVLHSFCTTRPHCADGQGPAASLVMDSSGNLYGTAVEGGVHHKGCCGVIFKIAPDGKNSPETVLYSFCALKNCKDGAQPRSDLILDSAGNLYGTANNGGGHLIDRAHIGGGTVFRLVGSTLETLHAFCSEKNCRDGEYPYSGVVMDASGNLFGTTSEGGRYGAGVVYEISP